MRLYNKDIDYDLYLDGKLITDWFEADIEAGKVWVDLPTDGPYNKPYKVLHGKVTIKMRNIAKIDYNSMRGI